MYHLFKWKVIIITNKPTTDNNDPANIYKDQNDEPEENKDIVNEINDDEDFIDEENIAEIEEIDKETLKKRNGNRWRW